MKVNDNFFLRSSSLNYICLFLKQKKHGFTAGRCLILYALARAWSPFKLLAKIRRKWPKDKTTTNMSKLKLLDDVKTILKIFT